MTDNPNDRDLGSPDTAADLTSLAGWITEQLADETADRQWIAESAAAKIRDITLQMLGAAELEQRRAGAELAARRTAAAAVRGDFEREWHGYSMQGGAEPAWQVWAQRLSESVASLLDAPAEALDSVPGLPAPLGGWKLTFTQLFRDGIRYVEMAAAVPCAECDALPDGLCDAHEIKDYPGQVGFYRRLAGLLGIEVGL